MKSMLKKPYNQAFIILLFVYLITVSGALSRGHDWGDDFASYIMQAKSILTSTEQQFYEHNSFTILNSSEVLGPVAYPWGYPLILAPFYKFFGLHRLALKIPTIIFFALFLIVFFTSLSRRLSGWERVLLCAVLAFNPFLLSFQDQIWSDIPFLFFSTLAIFQIDSFVYRYEKFDNTSLNYLLLGLSIFLANFMRTTGVLLLGTFLICQLIRIGQQWKKNKKIGPISAIWLIPHLVYGGLRFIVSIAFPSGESSYLMSIPTGNFAESLLNNIHYYANLMEDFMPHAPSARIVYSFLLVSFCIGLTERILEDYPFILYGTFTIGILLLWPPKQGLRFFIPIIPFFLYFSFMGMKILFSSLRKIDFRTQKVLTWLIWIVLVITSVTESFHYVRDNLANNRQVAGPFDPGSSAMFNFIRESTAADSTIIFFKPRAMRLITDRDSIQIDNCTNLIQGNFVVLLKEKLSSQVPWDAIDSCRLKTKPVFENERFIVYEINK